MELFEELREFAEKIEPTNKAAAVVLYTLVGAVVAGAENDLARIAADFAEKDLEKCLAKLQEILLATEWPEQFEEVQS